jgi:predicted dehydrogenase
MTCRGSAPMHHILTRRTLLTSAAAAVAGTAAANGSPAAERIRVAIMGLGSRGSTLVDAFLAAGAEVAGLCDVDENAAGRAADVVAKRQEVKPRVDRDIRRLLDDASIDAVVVAAPNHWHAPATILACSAGKHVYVEKPCSHTPEEGELAVAAARKHGVVVQHGTQRRSWPWVCAAVKAVQDGTIGPVHLARSWYTNRRPSIGRGERIEPPSTLDWTLWQGPAPERPFASNVVPYHWHWRWHWGNGELGNNGVHGLDVARWALGLTFPTRVVSAGGRWYHDDDQETPDTLSVAYEFPGGKQITWEGQSCSPLGNQGSTFGVSFHGPEASLVIDTEGWRVLDGKNVIVSEHAGSKKDDVVHVVDFLDAIRDGRQPVADIAEGHASALLCHLGTIAHRTDRVLHTRPEDGHIVGNDDAVALWTKEYRPGWRPA